MKVKMTVHKTTNFDGFQLGASLLAGILLFILTLLAVLPEQVYAQEEWPPFRFRMNPSYQEGKITYNLTFSKRVEAGLTDVTIKIPLPEGTRFLEAGAESSTNVNFDGTEITFFAAAVHRPIRQAYFTVEVIDPTTTVYTTHAWISWKGNQPGDYLTDDESIDITLQPLNWEAPPRSRLQLQVSTTVTNTDIIYTIYPLNDSNRRIWDLRVTMPVPEGTQFLSAEAPPPFTTDFDGQEATFSIIELEKKVDVMPLRLRVSASETITPFLTTHAWATWKNAGRGVGLWIEASEGIGTGDVVVQQYAPQLVISDVIGDTPFGNYDLTSVALQDVLQEDQTALNITFYVAEPFQIDEPLDFSLWIDHDCRSDTGRSLRNIAADYQVTYNHEKNRGRLSSWNEQNERWQAIADLNSLASGKIVTMWLPYHLINNSSEFCWLAQAKNKTKLFDPSPPSDWIPHWQDSGPARYKAAAESALSPFSVPPLFYELEEANREEPDTLEPLSTSRPPGGDISGKLAVPLNNDQGLYDVHVFSIPDGNEIARIPNARQPHFRLDGQRMLVNREGIELGNLFEYDFADGTQKQVSDSPGDSRPFYNLDASQVVYDNPELLIGAGGQRRPSIFLQCSLLPPHQEILPQCQDTAGLVLILSASAGQIDTIQGSHPVWTANDMIAYTGCSNIQAGSRLCGIYTIPISSTRSLSDGFIPTQLTESFDDIASDTKDDLIAFSTRRDGNWEAYVMNLDGTDVRNLSRSPTSNEGLPTISPDGNWLAFVSDRGDQWAIWIAPLTIRGPAQKLFDLPADIPWGTDNRTWTNERISWAP